MTVYALSSASLILRSLSFSRNLARDATVDIEQAGRDEAEPDRAHQQLPGRQVEDVRRGFVLLALASTLVGAEDDQQRRDEQRAVEDASRRVADPLEDPLVPAALEIAAEDGAGQLPERVAGETNRDRAEQDAPELLVGDGLERRLPVGRAAATEQGDLQRKEADERVQHAPRDQAPAGEPARPRAARRLLAGLPGLVANARQDRPRAGFDRARRDCSSSSSPSIVAAGPPPPIRPASVSSSSVRPFSSSVTDCSFVWVLRSLPDMDALNLVEESLVIERLQLSILRPADSEALLSEEAFEHEEYLPYWAELWPSGVALARAVGRRAVAGAARARAGLRAGPAEHRRRPRRCPCARHRLVA